MANLWFGVGRLSQDPRASETSNGIVRSNFSVAIKRKYSTKNEADFIDCTAYKKIAEFVNKYAKKGMLVEIEGEIQTFTKDDNLDFPAQKRTYVLVNSFEILSTKEEMKRYNNREEVESVPQRKPKIQAYEDNEHTPFDIESSIPF